MKNECGNVEGSVDHRGISCGNDERFKFCMIYVASLLYHRMCVEQCWSIDLTSSGWLDGY